jgi:hypothetical protein
MSGENFNNETTPKSNKMILPHRIIEHKYFRIVDYEAKAYVNSYDSMCLCGSKLLYEVGSTIESL